MEQRNEQLRKWINYGLPLLIWLTLSLLSTTLSYSIYTLEGRNFPLWRVAWWQSVGWLLWALLMPIVLWMGRRFRLERGRLLKVLPIHLLASLVLILVQSVAQ